MTIWRGVFIEENVDLTALARGLANAFGVGTARVAIVAADEDWLTPSDGFEVVAETSPTCGEARLMAVLFLFRDPAEVERLEDRAVVQALADGLSCTVLVPDDADISPFSYLRFRPRVPVDRVSLDPDGLDDRPPRVEVYGPAPPLAEAAPPPRRVAQWAVRRCARRGHGGVDRVRGDAESTQAARREPDVPPVPPTKLYCDKRTANVAGTCNIGDSCAFGAAEPCPYQCEHIMTLRTSASMLLASLLVAASFGAAANAATPHHRHARGAHHATQARSGMTHDRSGSAATDALNEQSLNSARNGMAPSAATPATSSMPAQ